MKVFQLHILIPKEYIWKSILQIPYYDTLTGYSNPEFALCNKYQTSLNIICIRKTSLKKVRVTGVEPARPNRTQGPQPCASTNSAIHA